METDGEGRLLEFLRSAFEQGLWSELCKNWVKSILDRRDWGQNRLSSFEKMLRQLIKIIIKNRIVLRRES